MDYRLIEHWTADGIRVGCCAPKTPLYVCPSAGRLVRTTWSCRAASGDPRSGRSDIAFAIQRFSRRGRHSFSFIVYGLIKNRLWLKQVAPSPVMLRPRGYGIERLRVAEAKYVDKANGALKNDFEDLLKDARLSCKYLGVDRDGAATPVVKAKKASLLHFDCKR